MEAIVGTVVTGAIKGLISWNSDTSMGWALLSLCGLRWRLYLLGADWDGVAKEIYPI